MKHKAHAQREVYMVAGRENAPVSSLLLMDSDDWLYSVVSGKRNCALRSTRRVVSYFVVVISVVDIVTAATAVQWQSLPRPRVLFN